MVLVPARYSDLAATELNGAALNNVTLWPPKCTLPKLYTSPVLLPLGSS